MEITVETTDLLSSCTVEVGESAVWGVVFDAGAELLSCTAEEVAVTLPNEAEVERGTAVSSSSLQHGDTVHVDYSATYACNRCRAGDTVPPRWRHDPSVWLAYLENNTHPRHLRAEALRNAPPEVRHAPHPLVWLLSYQGLTAATPRYLGGEDLDAILTQEVMGMVVAKLPGEGTRPEVKYLHRILQGRVGTQELAVRIADCKDVSPREVYRCLSPALREDKVLLQKLAQRRRRIVRFFPSQLFEDEAFVRDVVLPAPGIVLKLLPCHATDWIHPSVRLDAVALLIASGHTIPAFLADEYDDVMEKAKKKEKSVQKHSRPMRQRLGHHEHCYCCTKVGAKLAEAIRSVRIKKLEKS